MNNKFITFFILTLGCFISNASLPELAASLKLLGDTLPKQPEKPTLTDLNSAFEKFAREGGTEPIIPNNMDKKDKEKAETFIEAIKAVKGNDEGVVTFLAEKRSEKPDLKIDELINLKNEATKFEEAIRANKKNLPTSTIELANEWESKLSKVRTTLEKRLETGLPQAVFDTMSKLESWAKADYTIDGSPTFNVTLLNTALKGYKTKLKNSPTFELTSLQRKVQDVIDKDSLDEAIKGWSLQEDIIPILTASSPDSNSNPFYHVAHNIRNRYNSQFEFKIAIENNFLNKVNLEPYAADVALWNDLIPLLGKAIDAIKNSKNPADIAYDKVITALYQYSTSATFEGRVTKEINIHSTTLGNQKKKDLEEFLNTITGILNKIEDSCDKKTKDLIKDLNNKQKQDIANPDACINALKTTITKAQLPESFKEAWKKWIDEHNYLFKKPIVLSAEDQAIIALANYALSGKNEPEDTTLNNADPSGNLVKAKTVIQKATTWTQWPTNFDEENEKKTLKKLYKALPEANQDKILYKVEEARKNNFKATLFGSAIGDFEDEYPSVVDLDNI